MADLDYLITSTHLISNAHQQWAEQLESRVEQPLNNRLFSVEDISKNQQIANTERVNILVNQLQMEETNSYKLGKKKQRDLATLQNVSFIEIEGIVVECPDAIGARD